MRSVQQVYEMTNQEILTKAIAKTLDGGWEYVAWYLDTGKYLVNMGINIDVTLETLADDRYAFSYIFTHEFAKALWGEHPVDMVSGKRLAPISAPVNPVGKEWQYHLQQMVIADDPIKYLGDHLD